MVFMLTHCFLTTATQLIYRGLPIINNIIEISKSNLQLLHNSTASTIAVATNIEASIHIVTIVIIFMIFNILEECPIVTTIEVGDQASLLHAPDVDTMFTMLGHDLK